MAIHFNKAHNSGTEKSTSTLGFRTNQVNHVALSFSIISSKSYGLITAIIYEDLYVQKISQEVDI